MHLMMRHYGTNSIKRKTLSDGGGKIIRLYPRPIAFRDKPALPVRDKSVIRLPEIASKKFLRGRKLIPPRQLLRPAGAATYG